MNAFIAASKKQSKRILEITTEKLVSIDFNHNSASAIIDALGCCWQRHGENFSLV